MTLDPQAAAHLQRLQQAGFGGMHNRSPSEVREGMRRLSAALGPGQPVARVEDRTVETEAGQMAVRIYHPSPAQTRPVIVFFHGGGFVLGSLDTHDGMARALAVAADCVVVSIDYPLAPEHKYPAAPRAALAATRWVAAHAQEFGGDAARLAVAGDSAGGNLAAVVALMARDAGAPRIAFQLLIYPDVDFRRTNVSVQAFAGKHGNVAPETQHWFMDHYLRREEEKLDPLVSPLLAPDLSRLPPALIVTAEYDALRDEGEAYGERLRQAGVDAVVTRYDGMIHEFMRWPFDASRRAFQEAGAAVRTALEAASTS